jgi:hypothetical protein
VNHHAIASGRLPFDKPHKPAASHASVLLSREILTFSGFPIESPHKPLPPARPRWRKVSHIITRIQHNQFITLRMLSCPLTRTTCGSRNPNIVLDLPSQSGEGNTQPFPKQRPSPNERTCIGWHKRYASVSGRSSRGIYVPRR